MNKVDIDSQNVFETIDRSGDGGDTSGGYIDGGDIGTDTNTNTNNIITSDPRQFPLSLLYFIVVV